MRRSKGLSAYPQSNRTGEFNIARRRRECLPKDLVSDSSLMGSYLLGGGFMLRQAHREDAKGNNEARTLSFTPRFLRLSVSG